MANVHRMKIKLLVKQGISEKVAMEEVLDGLIEQNEYMDGKLAECIEVLDPLQLDKIFGVQVAVYNNELVDAVSAGMQIFNNRRKENEED